MLKRLALGCAAAVLTGQAAVGQTCSRAEMAGRWSAELGLVFVDQGRPVPDGVDAIAAACSLRFRDNGRVAGECIDPTFGVTIQTLGRYSVNQRCQLTGRVISIDGGGFTVTVDVQGRVWPTGEGAPGAMSGTLLWTAQAGTRPPEYFIGTMTGARIPSSTWLLDPLYAQLPRESAERALPRMLRVDGAP